MGGGIGGRSMRGGGMGRMPGPGGRIPGGGGRMPGGGGRMPGGGGRIPGPIGGPLGPGPLGPIMGGGGKRALSGGRICGGMGPIGRMLGGGMRPCGKGGLGLIPGCKNNDGGPRCALPFAGPFLCFMYLPPFFFSVFCTAAPIGLFDTNLLFRALFQHLNCF